MFAVLEIAGYQYKVVKNQQLIVSYLNKKIGEEIIFKNILLKSEEEVIIGNPSITESIVQVKILDHIKDKKVIVFKKKRRKGYKVKNGHRQMLTKIQILSV